MLIIFTGISANTINLINDNSQFEYILFDQKEDTIFENEENFIDQGKLKFLCIIQINVI